MDIASVSNSAAAASRLSSVSAENSSRSTRTHECSKRDHDSIEVSPQARQAVAENRRDLIERVKLEIHAGTYENINKLNTAIDRMMADLSD